MKNVLTDRLRGVASSIALMGRTFLVAALVLCGASSRAGAQDLVASNSAIDRMRVAAGGQLTVSRSRRTGLATFLAPPRGAGIPIVDQSAVTASDRAFSFVESYGRAFGLRSRGDVSIDRVNTDDLGIDHVRMRQVVSGVPVTGGELVVHMRGRQVLAANGQTLDNADAIGTIPAVGQYEALLIAQAFASKKLKAPQATFGEPRLEILSQPMLGGRDFPVRLAWFVEIQDEAVREFVWIDASNRIVLLHFSQLTEAKSRKVYNGNSAPTLPGLGPVRSEGQSAIGDPDVDKAYDYSGNTYDYYLNNHNRDSFDNAGGQLISTVRHCPNGGPCPYANAFWNGTQMVYGAGYASADDVVAHELTHAVTERTANLFYYMQSGALNESFSDIFGETVDQSNLLGNDSPGVKWLLGEDLPIGAIRNMMTPTAFGDPGKMSDPQFFCTTDPVNYGDAGGVHENSGVPNHAYALMVDGGTYNNITVSGIGLTKAAKIQYRALTQYLVSSSDFLDNYNALQQACTDLVGTAGITSANCGEVKKALDAVQMSINWPCSTNYGVNSGTPALCSASARAVDTFFDGFESGLGNWVVTGTAGTPVPAWARTSTYWGSNAYATSGSDSLWGYNQPVQSQGNITLASNLTIPTGARLQFNHSFGFENSLANNYDGGIVEYSINGGASWNSLAGLYAAGANYNGTILATNPVDNPLGGQAAFVKDSFGYTASQYNLAGLAGQSQVRFRFRIGTDSFVDDYGWFIDDFRLYTCKTLVATNPASGIGTFSATLNGMVNPDGAPASGFFEYGLDVSYGSTTPPQSLGSGTADVAFSASISGLGCGAQYHVRAARTNSTGTLYGDDRSVFTGQCPAPTVTTEPATSVGLSSAVLNGTVKSNGGAVVGRFQYGLTTAYGIWTSNQSLGSGASPVPFSESITGLVCGTTYHFRAIGGSWTLGPPPDVTGPDATFATAACPVTVPVNWTHVVGVVVAGNSLSKTSGTPDFNAGAISLQILPSGLGSVEFTATETNTNRVVGLGNGDTDQGYTDIEYGIFLNPSGFLVFESGVSKTALTPFTAGDRFSVGVEGFGWVGYRRNGVLFYASSVAPMYPLVVDTSLFTVGATVTDAWVAGFIDPPPALTINDVSITEGNSGTANAVFTVTLSPTSPSTVTVVATTANGTATAGSDYTATGPATLAFAPGVSTQTFSVPVLGDTVQESNETFFVNLTSPVNAVIGDAQGVGTITNDDLPPAVIWTHVVGVVPTGNSLSKTSGTAAFNAGAISSQSLSSGDGAVEFTATETNTNRVAGLGNGDTNQDYPDIEYGVFLTPSGFLVFESGNARTASAPYSAGDRFSVGVESGVVKYRRNGVLFYTSLVAPSYPLVVDTSLFTIGSTVTDARVLGFIEPPPTLTINDVSIAEGDLGTTNAVFTVTLSPSSPSTVTVLATTANGTATAPSDYTTTGPTTLTFAPGVSTQTFSVPVIGDTNQESNETFFVNLTSPVNAAIGDAQGVGTITNDDLPPAVIWTHVVGVVPTGNSLAKTSGTAAFNAGAISSQSLSSGDGSVEFTATETNTNRVAGLGNGDTDQGYPDIEYGVFLTPSGFLVFESGNARTASAPYSAGDRFSVGVESGVVKYRRNGVLFYTSLVAPSYPLVVDTSLFTVGSTVTDVRVLGFVEPPPTLTINDVSIAEGDSGSANAMFTVTLSPSSPSTVTVVATTANGTATAGSDYTTTGPTTLTFAPGVLTQTFSVPVLGDTVQESNETFFVNLTSPVNAAIGDAQGVGTITNDDLPPAVIWTHVVGVIATGNSLSKTSGTAAFNAGAISSQSLSSGDGTVEFTATEANTNRVAGLGNGDTNQDYPDIEYGVFLTPSGFLVFESGNARTASAPYSPGDRFSVGVESGVVKYRRNGILFYTSLVAPSYPLVVDTSLFTVGSTVTDVRVLGFIEPPPTLTINDVSIAEGDLGTTNAVFTVTLSPSSPSTVTVLATTANGTATAPSDYTTTGPTTLTFAPGVSTQTFSVPVLGDTTQESNETFFVNLTSPVNAVIGDAQGVGTITNDDLPPAVIWTHVVGVVATGNSLAKTSGTAAFNAGAISSQSLSSGDGSVEFTATETNTNRVVGLGNGDTNQDYPDIEYGVFLTPGGFLVFESGNARTVSAPYSAGDRFSVGVESGVVKYRRNGVLFYTSLIAPSYPLVVDTSLFTVGSTVTDARVLGFIEPPPTLTINDVSVAEGDSGTTNAMFTVTLSPSSPSTVTVVATTANGTATAGSDYTTTGPTTLTFAPGVLTQTFSVPVLGDTVQESNETFFVNLTSPVNAAIGDAQGVGTIVNDDLPPAVIWTHVVGVVATGNSLSKTSGTADFNAGAISSQSLSSGDGMVEFTATETNTNRVVGLGNGDTNQSYTDIEYGIFLTPSGFLVFESGNTRTVSAPYAGGDRFSVGVESGVVKYRRNGALLYTSLIAPVYPLVVDTSLFTIGATVTDVRVTGFFGPPIP